MANTELVISTSNDLNVEHSRYGMTVTISAETSAILDHFNAVEIVAYFGAADLLDVIGEKEAVSHFGIE